ncbi:MAG: hypothetical protein PUF12_04225 [Thermoflexaceae bacterium]|nr:hypothetical protein [Thermoflexaceae bacterium]
MSFCPKCKSEYINGRPTCADCGTPLVESLDDIIEESFPETSVQTGADVEDELENTLFENEETKNTESEKPDRVYTYVSKKEKYKDYVSTGYTFLIVGIAGLIIVTLNLLDIIRLFHVSGASSILFYGVMYAMFVIFVFVSINSFKNSRCLKQEAETENNFLEELNRYLKTAVTKESFAETESIHSEEELYFNRTEIIRHIIVEKYPEIDNSLLEQTIDETYDRLFQ